MKFTSLLARFARPSALFALTLAALGLTSSAGLHAQTAADLTPAALVGKSIECTIVGGVAPFETRGFFVIKLSGGSYSIDAASGNATYRSGTYTATAGSGFVTIRLGNYLVNNFAVEIELYGIGTATATAQSGAGKTYFEMFAGQSNKRGTFKIPDLVTGGGGGTTTPPAITTQPAAQSASIGGSATFTAAASGTGNTYQWRFNATNIAGATGATYTIPSVTAANAGTYTVVITNAGGTATSNAATLTVAPAGASGAYLSNLSIRSNAGSGPQTLIVGVSVGGTGTSGTKNILIRGVGPTLSAFGLTGVLADPQLTVYNGQTIADSNDNWSATATPVATQSSVGAFALTPGSKDAALIGAGVPAGSYSVQITGVGGTTGLALAELYDLTPASSFTATTPRLNNISARTQVGTGGDILITGFNVSGTGTRRLLIRAVGPTLAAFGVTGTLADPQLSVFSGQTVVASNDNWDATATPVTTQTGAGGFALTPASKDAALIVNLAPGSYTAQVSGVANTTGVALVEIYELP